MSALVFNSSLIIASQSALRGSSAASRKNEAPISTSDSRSVDGAVAMIRMGCCYSRGGERLNLLLGTGLQVKIWVIFLRKMVSGLAQVTALHSTKVLVFTLRKIKQL